MKKGDWIFIGNGKSVSLMCQVHKVEVDKIHFTVENGAWDGIYYPEKKEVYVCYTRMRYQQELLYDIQDMPRGDYNYVIEAINERLRGDGPFLRAYTAGSTHNDCSENIRPTCRKNNTLNETVSEASKLRRVLLSPTRYLAIDLQHKEVRLFERQNKRNVFLRSMPI